MSSMFEDATAFENSVKKWNTTKVNQCLDSQRML